MASIIPDGRLVHGMQLPVQSQSRLYAESWEADAGRDALEAMAVKADKTGFFYLGVCDHVAIPRPRDTRMGTIWYDTVGTLGWLAGITQRARLLSHVFNITYRHPLLTAKAFTTLDELSGGRIILGMGAGHLEGEFALLGIDFSNRGPAADEAIDAIAAAVIDEYPQHSGELWSFRDAGIAPRPRQARIPIWVGGSSRPALRRAAERGDGWLPQGTRRRDMPDAIAYLLEHRKRTRGDEPIDIGAISEVIYVGDPSWDVGSHTLAGDPEVIAAGLRGFGGMGVSHVQVRFRNRSLQELLDQMDAFHDTVAPLLNT